jgi:uncharacterized protein (TIGR00162 family)
MEIRRVMTKFVLEKLQEPTVNNPILIEGLPGIGHVGRLAVKHLTIELKATKFATMYSNTFPPQVLIKENGIIQEMKNEFYFWKADDPSKKDIIFLTGNTQASTPEGQYALSNKILEIAVNYGVKIIYTLGGLGVGRLVETPKVFGAVTHDKLIPPLEKLNVIMKREGVGQIIGVSGMILGLAKVQDIDGICLMGETSGYYLDPNSSKAVLSPLTKLLNLKVDMNKLSEKAKAAKLRVAEAQKIERKMMENLGVVQKEPSEEQMRYIG